MLCHPIVQVGKRKSRRRRKRTDRSCNFGLGPVYSDRVALLLATRAVQQQEVCCASQRQIAGSSFCHCLLCLRHPKVASNLGYPPRSVADKAGDSAPFRPATHESFASELHRLSVIGVVRKFHYLRRADKILHGVSGRLEYGDRSFGPVVLVEH